MENTAASKSAEQLIHQDSALPDEPVRSTDLDARRWYHVWLPLLVVLIIGTTLVTGTRYYLINQKPASPTSAPLNESVEPATVRAMPVSGEANIPNPNPGFKQYINPKLRYGFSYPERLILYECPDISCLSIRELSLRVDALSRSELAPSPDTAASLLKNDLYCSADLAGAGGWSSIYCENHSADAFINPLGFAGFIIQRTKIFEGTLKSSVPLGRHPDTAFVFLLQIAAENVSKHDPGAMLFGVEDPTNATSTAVLKQIADSFFLF